MPELVAMAVQDLHYKDLRKAILGDQRRAQRGAARARRRRLPGDPDGGAADPSARRQGPASTRCSTPTSWSRCSTTPCAACARRPRSGATPAGATRRSSACSPRRRATRRRSSRCNAHRRRRHHLRDLQLRRHGSRGDRQGDHGQEGLHRRGRSPHAAGRDARRRSRR